MGEDISGRVLEDGVEKKFPFLGEVTQVGGIVAAIKDLAAEEWRVDR